MLTLLSPECVEQTKVYAHLTEQHRSCSRYGTLGFGVHFDHNFPNQRKSNCHSGDALFTCIGPIVQDTLVRCCPGRSRYLWAALHLQSPAMSLLARSTSSSTAAARSAAGCRIKPFTPAIARGSKRVQKHVARAAEDEAIAEAEAAAEQQAIAEEFDFNYSDAKKGNQWQPSDVEAALSYYEGEKFLQGSSEMPYEAEFVTNPLSAYPGGPEDSSWLQDVDNNEAYETDDYALAGIPEAAPKVKRDRRDEEEENDEELRAVEEEKITAAAFDDIEGFADEEDDSPEAAWNWRFEGDAAEEEVEVAGVQAVVVFINQAAVCSRKPWQCRSRCWVQTAWFLGTQLSCLLLEVVYVY